jgi:hypothetical protein
MPNATWYYEARRFATGNIYIKSKLTIAHLHWLKILVFDGNVVSLNNFFPVDLTYRASRKKKKCT